MIYSIIISPIETLFEWFFTFVYVSFPSIGVIGAIVALSLCVNLLTLPLYNMAERIQDSECRTVKGMEKWVLHIKRTFKGDERFMMLSELYRQNNWHPIFALRNTLSILIQLPFFIAAYHYLRANELLNDVSFSIIKDLSAPDSLISLKFGELSFKLNVLPFAMTFVNCVSGAVCAKKNTRHEKIQIYALAVVFLALLYNSPSGLVIYWTLNNMFSLVKNFIKSNLKNPRRLFIVLAFVFIALVHFVSTRQFGWKKKSLLVFSYALAAFCLTYPKLRGFIFFSVFIKDVHLFVLDLKRAFECAVKKKCASILLSFKNNPEPSFLLLLLSGASLAILTGGLLPSSAIATSPIEFSFLGNTDSPLFYIITAFFVSVGFFIFWPCAIYTLFGKKTRLAVCVLAFAFAICAIFNAYVFKCPWGNIDVSFNLSSLDILNVSSPLYKLVPFEIFLATIFFFFAAARKKRIGVISVAVFAICLGMAALSLTKIQKINSLHGEYAQNLKKYGSKGFLEGGVEKVYHFSKTKKNVVVLFLDRGVGAFVKGIFEAYPEIREKFDGFTWFPNTVSFSTCTVTSSPSLYGGYEYTDEEMNKRNSELLRDKNNESQLVLPKLFLDAGFSAVVTDPCWPNYKWAGDLSAYEALPNVVVKELEGNLYDNYIKEKGLTDYNDADKICKKQIVNFSFLQIIFPTMRKEFYEKMRVSYARKVVNGVLRDGSNRYKDGIPISPREWLTCFSHLYYLNQYTDFDAEKGAFINMHSMAAHDVFMPADDLETPAMENFEDVDNAHFFADAACFKQYAKWFDLLRDNGCYDNTRIIIVSDHGYLGRGNFSSFDDFENPTKDVAVYYNPMLLIKDFDSHGEVKTDNAFMTSADTLFLAKEGLGLSDINPFTGKRLVPQKKDGVNIYWTADWNAANFYDAKQFVLPEELSYHVSDNIFDQKNWIPLVDWKKSRGGQK